MVGRVSPYLPDVSSVVLLNLAQRMLAVLLGSVSISVCIHCTADLQQNLSKCAVERPLRVNCATVNDACMGLLSWVQ